MPRGVKYFVTDVGIDLPEELIHGDGHRGSADNFPDLVMVGLVGIRREQLLDVIGSGGRIAVAFQTALLGGKGAQVAENPFAIQTGDGIGLLEIGLGIESLQHFLFERIGRVLRIAVTVGDLPDAVIEVLRHPFADAIGSYHRNETVAIDRQPDTAELVLAGEVVAGADRLEGDDARLLNRFIKNEFFLLIVVDEGGQGEEGEQNDGNNQIDLGKQTQIVQRIHSGRPFRGQFSISFY